MITADVGTANRLTIGSIDVRNAIFLVLADSLLTFPDNSRITGIIGFPVIAALGPLRLRAAGQLVIGEASSTRGPPNLALAGITPLAIAYWRGHRLLCRLDTGADNTDFYEPFFRRFRSIVEVQGESVARRMGGAGGVREVPVYELPNVALEVGDTVVTLPTADVLVQSIVEDEERNFLDCNLGNDVFGRFPEYIIDFRGMRFSVRG